MQNNQNTAVLVFTRTAAEEALYKGYIGKSDIKTNRVIATGFIAKTLEEANSSGFPVFTISSDKQIGNNFGERLTNAVSGIFEKGYDNVITIGTDTPDLTAAHLKKVAQLLNTHDYVSGPSTDGGAYILGFSKKVFDKKLLKDIPWQTSAVNNSLRNYFEKNGYSQTEIETLTDVDGNTSLSNWLSNSTNFVFVYYIGQLINRTIRHVDYTTSAIINHTFSSSISHRGPPIYS